MYKYCDWFFSCFFWWEVDVKFCFYNENDVKVNDKVVVFIICLYIKWGNIYAFGSVINVTFKYNDFNKILGDYYVWSNIFLGDDCGWLFIYVMWCLLVIGVWFWFWSGCWSGWWCECYWFGE